jgi:hypothetical protein
LDVFDKGALAVLPRSSRISSRRRDVSWDEDAPQLKIGGRMSILWIVLIVILVLALLGFFGRGRRSV